MTKEECLNSLQQYPDIESKSLTLSDFIDSENFHSGDKDSVNDLYVSVFGRKSEKYAFADGEKLRLVSLAFKYLKKKNERLKIDYAKIRRDMDNLRQTNLFSK